MPVRTFTHTQTVRVSVVRAIGNIGGTYVAGEERPNMRATKGCPVCRRNPKYGHWTTCTPTLRALVKAATTWYRQASNPTRSIYDARLCRAVARFRKEKERKA